MDPTFYHSFTICIYNVNALVTCSDSLACPHPISREFNVLELHCGSMHFEESAGNYHLLPSDGRTREDFIFDF